MNADELSERARKKKTELQGLISIKADHKDITAAAKEYIQLNYKWQEARFGTVKQKYSVQYLIRALA